MNTDLLTPKEAAAAMGLSIPTITRCVKRGAPVHRWGSTGYRYRIDVKEFVRWMERQRPGKEAELPQTGGCHYTSADELAARRRRVVGAR